MASYQLYIIANHIFYGRVVKFHITLEHLTLVNYYCYGGMYKIIHQNIGIYNV